jgi:hypothetical protein
MAKVTIDVDLPPGIEITACERRGGGAEQQSPGRHQARLRSEIGGQLVGAAGLGSEQGHRDCDDHHRTGSVVLGCFLMSEAL